MACNRFLLELQQKKQDGEISIENLSTVINDMFNISYFTHIPKIGHIKRTFTTLLPEETTPSSTSTSSNRQVLAITGVQPPTDDRPPFNRSDASAVTFASSAANNAALARQLFSNHTQGETIRLEK